MTATAAVQAAQYGMRELKGLYQKYAIIGLSSAFLLHAVAIGTYYGIQYMNQDDEPVATVRLMKYSELGPPPSITNSDAAPAVQVSVPVAKPTVGIPVAVPDAEVSPEQTIASQTEMSAISAPTSETGTGTGAPVVQNDVKIEDEDPPDFVAVEKLPELIKQVKPDYPEIARRAQVEGTVYVKVLVDKEGKPKKPSIVKSDAEIFNEPALAAAMQCLFLPAIMNNGPVAVWTTIPFHFKLNK